MKPLVFLIVILPCTLLFGQDQIRTDDVRVKFVSEAPLELIYAQTESCSGLLDIPNKSFAFRVKIRSFEGFNSPLQREHFNENYMESERFPNASFQGRFLDDINLKNPGNQTLRVKGILIIHGVEDERVLNLSLMTDDFGVMSFESSFEVQLETHNIDVPRIVYQKIAETISVSVKGEFN